MGYSAPPSLTNLAEIVSVGSGPLRWAVQEPGDLIFIPSGWWHSTVCLTETSAYTRNYINGHNFKQAIEALKLLHPTIATQLERWVWRTHMDDDSSDDGDVECLDTGIAAAVACTDATTLSRV